MRNSNEFVLATWCRPTFIQVTRVNSLYGLSIDDRTIDTVLVVGLLLLLLLYTKRGYKN